MTAGTGAHWPGALVRPDRWKHLVARALERERDPGRIWPPLGDARFWATQALVAFFAEAYYLIEHFELVPRSGRLSAFPLESLFVVPVVYAALSFGRHGALATAVWCTLITVPSLMFLSAGEDRASIALQVVILYAVATLVGSRVDRETKARAMAEDALHALRVSGAQYRAIFETAAEGIVVIREGGEIVECNAAAGALLGRTSTAPVDLPSGEMLPPQLHSALESCPDRPEGERATSGCPEVMLRQADGRESWIQPVCTPLSSTGSLTQIVLRDVTEQKHRQAWLQSYATQILQAQEEERRRIAQELHDDTVQSLVLLCRRLDAIEEDHGARGRQQPAPFRELRRDVESTMESLRFFLHGLRPSILDDLGLIPAIRALLTDLAARSDIRTEFVVEGATRRLPADAELALYRIMQEALRNAEKHSNASEAVAEVTFTANRVELRLRDNGKGFDPSLPMADLVPTGRLGLIGMRERAQLIGGNLDLQSCPGDGTAVSVVVDV